MSSTLKPLTLIVATTSNLGIGRAGNLPWPPLKQEMAYFAHVTKRPPRNSATPNTINAVIMGRKTWDSIPPKFRPLKHRINIVISGSMKFTIDEEEKVDEGPLVATSLDSALEILKGKAEGGKKDIGDIFVIGGSSVYAAALEHPQTTRVLVTKIVEPEFECDTFFPMALGTGEAKENGWRQREDKDLVEFVGKDALGMKDGDEGLARNEKNVKWKYCLFEREVSV